MERRKIVYGYMRCLAGWLAVTIGLNLSTKSTAIVEGIALLAFVMIIIKDWKRLAGFDIVGRVCFLAGGILGLSVMTGILQGVPLPVWSLSSFALFGIGLVSMCWGAHRKNPEKVTKKVVYLAAGFWIFLLIYWGILFMLRYHFY